MLKIGNLKLKSNLILAPMAGISDYPFRMLNRKFGAELTFIEMINCRSISFKSKRTKQMLHSSKDDRPLGVQILGSEGEYVSKALDVLSANYKFDILDFNAACPAKKVVRRGEGSGLLREHKKLQDILDIIVKKIKHVPVTIKIRIGWDKDSVNAIETAKLAQDSGVKAIFVHGRTKVQGYSGSVDYKIIRAVKKTVKIPVIASGDIFSARLAKKMLDQTGCDGLAVARGSLGNPWIFKEISEYLKTGIELPRPDKEEIIKVMVEHLDRYIDFYGEKNGVIIFRKFFGWYTKGFRQIRQIRQSISRIKSRQEIIEIVTKLKD